MISVPWRTAAAPPAAGQPPAQLRCVLGPVCAADVHPVVVYSFTSAPGALGSGNLMSPSAAGWLKLVLPPVAQWRPAVQRGSAAIFWRNPDRRRAAASARDDQGGGGRSSQGGAAAARAGRRQALYHPAADGETEAYWPCSQRIRTGRVAGLHQGKGSAPIRSLFLSQGSAE